MKNLLLLLTVTTILSCSKNDEISRQTSNDVPQVQIGSQIWAKRNLDVSTYRNGDTIPQVTDPTEWRNLTTGAWCYYNNDPEMGKIYGKLYNWEAVSDPRGLAPQGWKIPSDSDWTILTNYLGGDSLAGVKLKESGTEHWIINFYGTNNYGFSALPNGIRCEDGAFCVLGIKSNWWSNTYLPPHGCFPGGGVTRSLYGEDFGFYQNQLKMGGMKYFYGLSVRCLKN
jgi:uncharacterized protein (TIGR02145 family)